MKKDVESGNGNVIDMTSRIHEPEYKEYLRSLKVRFDLEHAKVAVSASLLSIVVLVTLANNNLMTSIKPQETHEVTFASRGIASVSSVAKDSQASQAQETSRFIKALASRDLGPNASVGQKPSPLEKLAFGYLEGKYAVRLNNGLLKEIELTEGMPSEAKALESVVSFLDSQRELLPAFERVIKVGSEKESAGYSLESYQLVNEVSMPVAKVQFRMGEAGKLLALKVATLHLASVK